MRKVWMPLMLCAAIVSPAAAQSTLPKVSVTRWPQDRAAAISLTFDDGINTHLDVVGPILKKHHLNGTFFVATGMGPWEERKSEWKQLADQGNELGNHTVHHPCLLPQITPHSQDYTPEMMEAEIRDAAQQIKALTNSQRGLTFAYPCGNMSFGKPQDEAKNSALFLRYVSENSFGARAVGAKAESPDELNVLAVNDLGPTMGKGFGALLELGQPALRENNWGVYCFHGVGGDWLSITADALDELAGYLERHPEIWTATFGDVLRYVQERKATSLRVSSSDANSVNVTVDWPMDKKIYDVPLTLKLELATAWNDAQATGDGKPLEAKIVERTSATILLISVPAQTADVRITKRP